MMQFFKSKQILKCLAIGPLWNFMLFCKEMIKWMIYTIYRFRVMM